MRSRLQQVARLVAAIEAAAVTLVEVLAGTVLVVLVGLVFVAVVDRFVIGVDFPWTEELARYLLIWLSMLSAALAVPKGYHYVVDYFYKRMLKLRGQRLVGEIGSAALGLVTVIVLFRYGAELAQRVSWQQAPALEVSMGWAYAALPVSFGLMALFFLGTLVQAVVHHATEDAAVAGREPFAGK